MEWKHPIRRRETGMAKLRSLKVLKRECLKAWGKVILRRYPDCFICRGSPSRHAHHLFPRSRYLHLHYDLRNGIGLCIKCHYLITYDPIIPLMQIMSNYEHMGPLIADAMHGRRRTPYKRTELNNILIALQEAGQ